MATESQRKKARATLLRLRAENPEKFNPKTNGAKEKFIQNAKEKRKAKNSPPPAPAPQPTTPPPTPVTVPPAPPAPVVTAPPAPAPQPTPPPPPPATVPPAPEIKPPPQIVAQEDLFSPPPPPQAEAQPQKELPPIPDQTEPGAQPPPPGGKSSPGINRALAQMVWGMILQILVTIFGDGFDKEGKPNPRTAKMLPQIFKTPAGDIDESEGVVTAWCDYFDSLGMKKLSPLWNLILTMAAYLLLRIQIILQWFTDRKKQNPKTAPQAGGQPSPKKEASGQPQPEPPQPEPAQPQKPQATTEEAREIGAEENW